MTKTHLIQPFENGAKWRKVNECTICGTRVGFNSDWTLYPVLASCA